MSNIISWEEAVKQLREQPQNSELVKACYYDDPLSEAAERFSLSDEWQETKKFFPPLAKTALDIGAGRGISSYALAKAGWQVFSLEPDPSNLVGCNAIQSLAKTTKSTILPIRSLAENLPFVDQHFSLIYCREVLHHIKDLQKFLDEAFRVMQPGGLLIAVREHVISKPDDLSLFLDNHALHKYYGGENALLLSDYVETIKKSGFIIKKTLSPMKSSINYFPMSDEKQFEIIADPLIRRFGNKQARKLANHQSFFGKLLHDFLVQYFTFRDHTPGRLYSFIAEKPY